MITKRKLNKKLDLLLYKQTMIMGVLLQTHLSYEGCKKIEKEWNKLWYEIMEGKYKIVEDEHENPWP